MNIYVHTPREWYELYEMGKRMFGCFIGHTSREILEHRFDDGDYSHFIEHPNLLRKYQDLHDDIKDHDIQQSLENELGWFRYNKLSEYGRSPDFFVTDLPPDDALKIIDQTVDRINRYFHSYEQSHGKSPATVRRYKKQRLQDYHRIIGSKLLNELYNSRWINYNRDARIVVIRDAHGRICEFLLSKGFTNITTDEHIQSLSDDKLSQINMTSELNGKFDYVIGNPPYNGGLYADFMKLIGDILDINGEFDILLPSYTFTRKTSHKFCKNNVLLESIDMSVGHHFANSISGTWVTRFTGKCGSTHDKPVNLILPNGDSVVIKLSDIVPSSEKFIKPNGLTSDDINIVRKVLNGTIQYIKHKNTPIDRESFAYIRPTLKYVAQPSPAAGSFTLHGETNQLNGATNGWMINCDNSHTTMAIYTSSKLFNFIHWMMVSDFPMVSESYIKLLPDVSMIEYKNEAELYEQFNLTESEIARVESIFP